MMGFLVSYLLNAVWRTPFALLGALLLCRFGRLPAHRRYVVFAAFLAISVVLPVLQTPVRPQGQTQETANGPSVRSYPPVHITRPPALDAQVPLGRDIGALICVAWLTVTVFAGLRLAAGLWRANVLVRRSGHCPASQATLDRLQGFTARHRVNAPKVRRSREIASPAVIGAWPAVILVPIGFETLAQEQIEAALLHECAHVIRRDYALNLACELLALPLIWHPAVHLLKSRLRAAREIACDGLAASEFGSRTRYARRLVDLARVFEGGRRLRPHTVLALIQPGGLEERVRHLLQAGPTRLGGGSVVCVAAATAVLVCLPTAGLHLTPTLDGITELRSAPPRQVEASRSRRLAPVQLAVYTPAPRRQFTEASAVVPSSTRRVEASRSHAAHFDHFNAAGMSQDVGTDLQATLRPLADPGKDTASAPAVLWSEARLAAPLPLLTMILRLDFLGSTELCTWAETAPKPLSDPTISQPAIVAAPAGAADSATPSVGDAPAAPPQSPQRCMTLAAAKQPSRTGAA